MYDGYQALGEVITDTSGSEVTYEMGYLDGWADAMDHFDWAYHGKPVKTKKAFPLFRARGARSLARDVLKKRRAKGV
jgi:ribosomal protein L34